MTIPRCSGNICATSRASSPASAEYPALPVSYFDAETEEVLSNFEQLTRAAGAGRRSRRAPRPDRCPDVQTSGAATAIFRDWPTSWARTCGRFRPKQFESDRQHAQPVVSLAGACLQSPLPASPGNAACPVRQGSDGELHLRRHSDGHGKCRRTKTHEYGGRGTFHMLPAACSSQ